MHLPGLTMKTFLQGIWVSELQNLDRTDETLRNVTTLGKFMHSYLRGRFSLRPFVQCKYEVGRRGRRLDVSQVRRADDHAERNPFQRQAVSRLSFNIATIVSSPTKFPPFINTLHSNCKLSWVQKTHLGHRKPIDMLTALDLFNPSLADR
jgi:hypothetical protein